MKKFNTLRLDLAEKTLTPAEKKKREEIAMAMERENPGMPMGKKMAIATAAAKRVAEENFDEEYEDSGEEHPKMWKHVSSVDSNTWSGVAKHHGKNLSNVVHDLEKERDSIKKKGGNHNATSNHDHAIMQLKQHLPSTAKRVAEENLDEITYIDELKTDTLDSYITKVATGPSRGNTQTGIPKSIKAIGGVTTAIRKRAENENPPFEPNVPTGERKDQFGNPIKNVAKHLAKQGMKSVTEEIKTTHEDPLVVVKDAEGNILTHANRSVAGDIHGINVSHHAIHTGMPVEVVDRDGKKLTVHKSMHHDSEVAKDSASAVKEEENKKYTHIVKHIKTGNVVGKYTSLKSATQAADKKDRAYGAVAHQVDYIREAKEKTEYDYEGDMARGQLQSIIMNAQRVHDMLKDNDNLPEWVQSKMTLAEDYISTVSNYMSSEIDEDKDPCWDNYKQFGMKKGKNGKPVPDCRGPVKEDSIDELTLSFGKKAKPTVSARISDMKKYFDTADKDQLKQKITGKKFHDMSEYETWMKSNKSKGAMQVASFEQGDENKLDEISSNTLHSYMKAAHTKYSNIDHKNDPASVAKKKKLEKGIKTAYNKKYPSKTSKPEDKVDMSSASSYYASKKPGQYTGD